MFENKGDGWWPPLPAKRKKPISPGPYAIAGLAKLTARARRYINFGRTGGISTSTSPHTPIPNNPIRKPFTW